MRCFKYSFWEFTITNNFLNLFNSNGGSCSISNEKDEPNKDVIIWYNFAELWEMPRIPFFDSHGKSVNILIQEFE